MRRILKEVAPISQDQILNEVLNPLIRHQNALNSLNTLNCINYSQNSRSGQQGKYLTASPQLGPLKMESNCINYTGAINSPSAKRMLNQESKTSQQSINQNNKFYNKNNLHAIQEEEECQASPLLPDVRMNSESDFECNESSAHTNKALLLGNNNYKHTNNQLNLIPKFLKSETRFFNNVNNGFAQITRKHDRDGLRKNTSCVDSHQMSSNHLMSSMRSQRHLPDDFMHIKRFTNLDTVHHDQNERLSNELKNEQLDSEYDSDFLQSEASQMDISDQCQKFQKKSKWRSAIADQNPQQDADIDSIVLSEPLDQILEETPNNIICQRSLRVQREALQNNNPPFLEQQQQPQKPNNNAEKDKYISPISPNFGKQQKQTPKINLSVLQQQPQKEVEVLAQQIFNHQMQQMHFQSRLDCFTSPIDQQIMRLTQQLQYNIQNEETNVPEKLSEIKPRSKGIKKDYDSKSQKSASSNRSMRKEIRKVGTVERKREETMDGDQTPPMVNKDMTMEVASSSLPQSCLQRMIGPLTLKQRHEKIMKYIMKKRSKGQGRKFTYECRKQVAEKRLRIKGRFVTKTQAFEILGLKEDDLRTSECLQKLLEQHYNVNQQQQYNTEVPYTSHIAYIMHHQLSKQSGPIQIQVSQQQINSRQQPHKPVMQLNSMVQNEKGESKMVKIRNFQALFEGYVPHQSNVSIKPQSSSNEPDVGVSFSENSGGMQSENQVMKSHSAHQEQGKVEPYTQMGTGGDDLSVYWSQQLSILELQEALQKQEIINGGDAFTFENYIQPLFKIERVVRFQSDQEKPIYESDDE